MNYAKISFGILVALAASRFIPHPPNFTSLLALSFYVPAVFGIRYLPALLVSFIITDFFIGFHSSALFTWGSVVFIGLLSQYFIRTESVTTPFEIDSMTADFIESGIYDIASKRVKKLESGYKYYFTMGLIEETQKNYSGAKMYYSEGELNTERKELFSNAIKRVDYFLRKK